MKLCAPMNACGQKLCESLILWGSLYLQVCCLLVTLSPAHLLAAG